MDKILKKDNTLFNLGLLFSAAIIFVLGIFAFYINTFSNKVITKDTQSFAFFGDFIGGTLNPILAFLAFLALLYTIKIQSDELSATREELKESRIAQQEQSDSLKLQNKATELQIFENTFFMLLKELNMVIDKLNHNNKSLIIIDDLRPVIGNIKKLTERFKSKNYGSVKKFNLLLYQILKFVDDSLIDNKKRYTNILRANMQEQFLYLLIVNCEVGKYNEYKKYLEDYAFFEHLNFDNDDIVYFNRLLKKYKCKVFGKNQEISDYIYGNMTIQMERFGRVSIT